MSLQTSERSGKRPRSARRRHRRGAMLVEFALTAPVLFLVFFAMVEFSRVHLIRNTMQNAAYEGARAGIVPGATVADVKAEVNSLLRAVSVVNATVDVQPTVIRFDTPEITVTIDVPMDSNDWGLTHYFSGRNLQTTFTLAREFPDLFGQ